MFAAVAVNFKAKKPDKKTGFVEWLLGSIKFAIFNTDDDRGLDEVIPTYTWKHSSTPVEIEKAKADVVKVARKLSGREDDARFKNAELVSVVFEKGDPELFEIKIQGAIGEFESYTETVYRTYGSLAPSESTAIDQLRIAVEKTIAHQLGLEN